MIDLVTAGIIIGTILAWGGMVIYLIGKSRENKTKFNHLPTKKLYGKKAHNKKVKNKG